MKIRTIILPLTICLLFAVNFAPGQGKVAPKSKLRVITLPDSIPSITASWTVDTVLVAGLPGCVHEFQTVPGSELQQYGDGSDSLAQLLNPNHERIIQVVCSKCGRQEIRLEHIVISKKSNPIKRKP